MKYKLKVKTLSPIHIGSSFDFEPTNYVINKEQTVRPQAQNDTIECSECHYKNPVEYVKQRHECGNCETPLELPKESHQVPKDANKYFLYTFNPKQISDAINPLALSSLAKRSEDIVELQGFFKSNRTCIIPCATKRAIVATEIAQKYEQECGVRQDNDNFGRKRRLNLFQIERTMSTGLNEVAYIPGSSLKGAFRTAILSAINVKKRLPYDKTKKGNFYEKMLLNCNDALSDPLRNLEVADALPEQPFLTKILTAKNYKKYQNVGAGQLPIFTEVIPTGTEFFCTLEIQQEWLSMKMICDNCNSFYGKLLDEQSRSMRQVSDSFFYSCDSNKENTFVACIGKHCGAEHITIENLRNIRIRRGEQSYISDRSTTYWAADDGSEILPFGWCIIQWEPF